MQLVADFEVPRWKREQSERARARERERERKKGEILQLSRPLPLCNAAREKVQRGCTRETERLRERKGD